MGPTCRPGGSYLMLCFSDQEPGYWGPRRVTRQEILTCFAGGRGIPSIEPTTLELTIEPACARAWRVAVTRL